mmetsp:Transcript_82286/g.129576  ORF Transcript_82286/g.129576 Transcript_82286/m.129576 type:complete len:169 (-) Transcript_82286:95-601(-)
MARSCLLWTASVWPVSAMRFSNASIMDAYVDNARRHLSAFVSRRAIVQNASSMSHWRHDLASSFRSQFNYERLASSHLNPASIVGLVLLVAAALSFAGCWAWSCLHAEGQTGIDSIGKRQSPVAAANNKSSFGRAKVQKRKTDVLKGEYTSFVCQGGKESRVSDSESD